MIESFLYNFSILHNINYRSINSPNLQYFNQLSLLNPVPFGLALIDSFTLTIPLDLIEILDHTLLEPARYIHPGKQTISLQTINTPVVISDSGIKMRYSKSTRIFYDKRANVKRNIEVMAFVITAKMLGYQYTTGLNSSNIHHVYNYINSQKIVRIKEYDFYNESRISDVDICVNYWFSSKVVWSQFLRCVQNRITLSKKLVKLFDSPESMGLNINSREGARPATPFVKFYHKGIELTQQKSIDFTNTFLLPEISHLIDHWCRVEVTVKDSKHRLRIKDQTGVEVGTTLQQLFDLTQSQLMQIHSYCVRCYVDKPKIIKTVDLSPIDDFIVNLINLAIKHGADLNEVFDCINFNGSNGDVTKVTNSRTRKKITQLVQPITSANYDSKVKKQLALNEEVNFFIETLLKDAIKI